MANNPPPSGTVTFLFTDIEGSTALYENYRYEMQAARKHHDEILRFAIESHRGYVFKTVGDAFCAAFKTATDALQAALAVQRTLFDERWPENVTIRVRMGLHTGVAEESEGDYFGPPVNRVERLMSMGHGGQVLLSDPTYNLVRDQLAYIKPDGELQYLGEHQLKDLRYTERIFQLVVPDLPQEFPPLRTRGRSEDNGQSFRTPLQDSTPTEEAEKDAVGVEGQGWQKRIPPPSAVAAVLAGLVGVVVLVVVSIGLNGGLFTLSGTLTGHSGTVNSLAFTPDAKLLVSGSGDETMKLWDPQSGQELQTVSSQHGTVNSLAFSPDATLLASGGGDGTIELWDPQSESEEVFQTLSGHSDTINSLAFSPDGGLLASGSKDETIKLWDPQSGQELQTLSGKHGVVNSLVFSPDGNLLASGSFEQAIYLWDAHSGEELQILSGQYGVVESLAFSPDGKLLASGGVDQTVHLWDPQSGEELQTLNGHSYSIESLAFSPDGKLLASGSWDKTIKLWDPKSGKELQTLSGHSGHVSYVTFDPNGNLLASGGDDNSVKLWERN